MVQTFSWSGLTDVSLCDSACRGGLQKIQISGISLERNFLSVGHVIPGYSPGRLSYYMPADRAHALGDDLQIF